jgi:hypothetical protein
LCLCEDQLIAATRGQGIQPHRAVLEAAIGSVIDALVLQVRLGEASSGLTLRTTDPRQKVTTPAGRRCSLRIVCRASGFQACSELSKARGLDLKVFETRDNLVDLRFAFGVVIVLRRAVLRHTAMCITADSPRLSAFDRSD